VGVALILLDMDDARDNVDTLLTLRPFIRLYKRKHCMMNSEYKYDLHVTSERSASLPKCLCRLFHQAEKTECLSPTDM